MTVDEYLEVAPETPRSTLAQLRASLREILPGATETMSYGKPAIKVEGKAVAGYAHFKNHCSYFPLGAVGSCDELEPYEWSKGTLEFAVDKPLRHDLVARLVAVRMEQLGLR